MFIVQCRYEYWSIYEGKKWTKWFNVHGESFDNKIDAENAMKINKSKSTVIDKSTKLKHEFQIVEI